MNVFCLYYALCFLVLRDNNPDRDVHIHGDGNKCVQLRGSFVARLEWKALVVAAYGMA